MNINRMFDEYLEYSKVYKIKPTFEYEETLIRSLKRCFESIQIRDTRQIKRNNVDSIVNYYQKMTKCKAISINHHIGLLKRITKHHKIHNEYLLEIPKLRTVKRHYPVFNENQLMLIFQYINKLNYSSNSYTYKTVIYMLLDTGCRINELLNIKISNINLNERNILLQVTKNKKERYVLFTRFSSPLVKNIINLNKGKTDYLFYNHIRNRKINYNDIKLFLRRIQNVTGIEKVHAHMFRRTFATKLFENGASLIAIQTLLGHETLEMTRNYIDVGLSTVKHEYDKHQVTI